MSCTYKNKHTHRHTHAHAHTLAYFQGLFSHRHISSHIRCSIRFFGPHEASMMALDLALALALALAVAPALALAPITSISPPPAGPCTVVFGCANSFWRCPSCICLVLPLPHPATASAPASASPVYSFEMQFQNFFSTTPATQTGQSALPAHCLPPPLLPLCPASCVMLHAKKCILGSTASGPAPCS